MSVSIAIHIDGMHCQHCAASIFNQLQALPGIESVEVNLEKAEAVVTGTEIDMDKVRAAIGDLGFEPGESKPV